ncbi:MAG: hypothetical protein AB8B79_03410 [Granulosicoccus sp.]
MRPQKLIPHDEWMKGTARRFKPRSKLLKSLDTALENYSRVCGGWGAKAAVGSKEHKAVALAFNAWKESKGSGDTWKHTPRDGNKLFTKLDAQLRGIGDSDEALGVIDFMRPEMEHARLGAVYLFSNLKCDDSMFSVVLEGSLDVAKASLDYKEIDYNKTAAGIAAGAADQGVRRIESAILAREGKSPKASSTQLLQAVEPPMSERLRQIWQTIRDKVLEFSAKIIDAVKQKLNEIRDKVSTLAKNPADAIMDNLGTILRKLVDVLTSRFLSDAVPFIGAGLEIVGGIVKTLDAAVTKFKEWLTGKEVLLAKGHITVIVESIQRAMTLSIGSGLFSTLKGGISLGAQFMTAGAAALVSLISSIIEAVVKTIWKLIEISRIRAFFEQAKMHWDTKHNDDALHKRPIAFNQWFKSYSLSLPILSVIALNSGITGSRMTFLEMYNSDSKIISQSQFDKGGSYLDGLKHWGSEYLQDTGFSISSDDDVVGGLLELAKNQTAPLTARSKAHNVVKQFFHV